MPPRLILRYADIFFLLYDIFADLRRLPRLFYFLYMAATFAFMSFSRIFLERLLTPMIFYICYVFRLPIFCVTFDFIFDLRLL
jgi:hypothetical protein